jgi:hypothetical protein
MKVSPYVKFIKKLQLDIQQVSESISESKLRLSKAKQESFIETWSIMLAAEQSLLRAYNGDLEKYQQLNESWAKDQAILNNKVQEGETEFPEIKLSYSEIETIRLKSVSLNNLKNYVESASCTDKRLWQKSVDRLEVEIKTLIKQHGGG